ncbi:hypothetical protein A2397_04615 [Candidatus Amesbacteria bacterium RIFOXYB1_FULL_44_23]|uniref:Uncharacterized protein n=1 Tax=Candidatus Amesbacteria bacterium RIFOXYB1_FULL_44_23 TaxID=1797263 RepID=A0A1F4ZUR8_9BACT|nr:MAG: hypothetical protein A2397_04615 [Candidatus Amesbacteria bacterium RIFOXYB1_FULL_44_23]
MTDQPTIVIPEKIKVQMQMQAYLDRSVDYYIFARKSVMLGVVPVGGTLFHIAVEMLLHAGLSVKYSQTDLERKFSKHELPVMWLEFKSLFSGAKLSGFDKFVNHHRQWKELRYPKSKSSASTIFFGRTKPDPEVMKRNMANFPQCKIQLEINLEEMDEFIMTIIHAIGINPDHIKIHLQRSAELLDMYLVENLHPLFSKDPVVNSTSILL